ncbi:muramoyltetrapeptide carboxypeptidase LdcA involved in peptidoglycan recycling [Planomicrobium soli]|uniref:Muramoyltetrapeptide carboxypeptidase LdcA involved in peptidoglycan recycling n=1 Tax=Planomicrobium soli TaxID=1176648 RepID=A0A2P8H6T8_9BACL|nr:S66 peptidase family protein [Planomicrobium soli]PSL41923.1 muramoyltetrapeptide carboxypeptidase LdcA involved in peptidoglycan recycling [Planomicrobium soli]
MIVYPQRPLQTIGVTAPSSGMRDELHPLLLSAKERQEGRGFNVQIGQTPWTQQEAKSAPARKRANELMEMLKDDSIDMIFPPWGGEMLIEILEHLDFKDIEPKWVLGYSDISLLLLAITLKTGIATAHGTNIIDLRGEEVDGTTIRWLDVLQTKQGEKITQVSSPFYQKEWLHENPSPTVFHLTEPTLWKTISGNTEKFSGRLLGGCIDVIRHLAGTPYGDVRHFRAEHIPGETVVWFFENCELSVTDLKRSLTQLKYAGWFENCSGILFGRSPANESVGGYTVEKMYEDLASELNIPIAYDVDCGHVPPQITLVNGSYAEIEVKDGKGVVRLEFK